MKVNVADRTYQQLRDAIVEGQYRPHQRLVETELAAELEASRTPVRQALQRLELEGLVSTSPHGWVVRDHSDEDVKQIYEVRTALEALASWLAVQRATDADIEHFREMHEKAKESVERGDREEFVRFHDEFHAAIVRSAANPVLAEAIRQHRQHPFNRRVADSYTEDELWEAVESHAELLDAIARRSADDAADATHRHLAMSRRATLNRLALRY